MTKRKWVKGCLAIIALGLVACVVFNFLSRSSEQPCGWFNSLMLNPHHCLFELTLSQNDLAWDHPPSFAFSPDSRILAWENPSKIELRQVPSGELLKSLNGTMGPVTAIAFSPNGATLASESDRSLQLWDVGTGRVLRAISGRASRGKVPQGDLVFSHDGNLVVFGSTVVDVHDGHTVLDLPEFDHVALSQEFGIALGWNSRSLEVSTFPAHERLWQLSGAFDLGWSGPETESVALSPDGSTVVASKRTQDGTRLSLFKSRTGELTNEIVLHDCNPDTRSMAFSPDSANLAVAAYEFSEIDGRPAERCMEITNQGVKVRANIKGAGQVSLWLVSDASQVCRLNVWGHHLGFSTGGGILVTSDDGSWRFWNVKQCRELRTISYPGRDVFSMPTFDAIVSDRTIWAFAPDGNAIALSRNVDSDGKLLLDVFDLSDLNANPAGAAEH